MKRSLLVAFLVGTAFAAPVQAMTINLIDTGGVAGSQAALGFEIAARYWEHAFTNDAIVNFNVGFDHLGENILGGTSSTLSTYVPIDAYKAILAASGTTALDAVVQANLPATNAAGSVTAIVPNYYDVASQAGVANAGTRIAPTDGEAISSTIALSTANLKALVGSGNAALNAVIDGNIKFSSDFDFDFNPTDGIASGAYDFVGVAIHEMGHALGFLSGADDFDYSTPNAGADDQAFPTDEYWWGYALDMFRYSAPGELNWAFDQPSYFSIDGGATAFNGVSYFSTGEINGDGWQASHWKAPVNGLGNNTCSLPYVGTMNPYTCNGQTDAVTANDLALFDTIGWNTRVDVLANPTYRATTAQIYAGLVPEPSSWALMLGGFGAIGVAMRSRRKVAVRFG